MPVHREYAVVHCAASRRRVDSAVDTMPGPIRCGDVSTWEQSTTIHLMEAKGLDQEY
jgi:hypothetical protein